MNISRKLAAASLACALVTSPAIWAASPQDAITLMTDFGKSEVLAWSWGASNSGSFQAGGGGGAGKANFQDMAITRATDAQSPEFVKALAAGTALNNVDLRRGSMSFRLGNVRITSYSVGGSADNKAPQTENITFTFEKIRYTVDGKDYCFNATTNGDC